MVTKKPHLQNEIVLTKQFLDDPNKTLPARIFSTVGRIICKITGRKEKETLPWQFNLAVLALLVQIPTLIVSILLKEFEQWRRIGIVWMFYIELGIFATVLAHISVIYIYKNMNIYIVDRILREEDLIDLRKTLAPVGNVKKSLYFTIAFTIFWCMSFTAVSSSYINEFIGYGLFTGTVVFGLFTGPAIYLEGCYFLLITHIGRYNFRLNDTSPAHSEVIYRLSRIATLLMYSYAVFIAFSTIAVSFNIGAVLLVTLIGWVPTIIYFTGSQLSIGRIVVSAKWISLNRIQERIRSLNQGDITEKKNIEAVIRLMDFHERIRATPNSALNIVTGLNFLNQLALPLFGLLLANVEKLFQLMP